MQIDAAEMELRGTFPVGSKYGVDDEGRAAFEDVTYVLDIKSPASPARVRQVFELSERYCHAEQSLLKPVPVIPLLRVNGEEAG